MSKQNNLKKIKQLRDLTGAGFKDCNNAIIECNGDIEKSIEYLRVKGISKASKKMERSAKEGLICLFGNKNSSSIIEINCETDFVAKNDEYIKFCEEISEINFNQKGDLDSIKKNKMKDGKIVNEKLIELISKIGEKITITRAAFISNSESENFSYIHNLVNDNTGKLGVIASIKGKNKDSEVFKDFGKKLCMHIAASNPLSITIDDLDKKLVENEKRIIEEELKSSGKPQDIVDKISKGKLEKFRQENTLLNQYWVMDPQKKVKEIIKDLNLDISIIDFIRYKVGE
tara:strand:+ start:89 stop:949 length:861 start_codon:yes stop_codon:yes gene_type:complete